MAQCDCKVVCLKLIPSAELVDEQPKNLQEYQLQVPHKLHEAMKVLDRTLLSLFCLHITMIVPRTGMRKGALYF